MVNGRLEEIKSTGVEIFERHLDALQEPGTRSGTKTKMHVRGHRSRVLLVQDE